MQNVTHPEKHGMFDLGICNLHPSRISHDSRDSNHRGRGGVFQRGEPIHSAVNLMFVRSGYGLNGRCRPQNSVRSSARRWRVSGVRFQHRCRRAGSLDKSVRSGRDRGRRRYMAAELDARFVVIGRLPGTYRRSRRLCRQLHPGRAVLRLWRT